MSHICHPSKIEFPFLSFPYTTTSGGRYLLRLLIQKSHLPILWLTFDPPRKKSTLHLPVVTLSITSTSTSDKLSEQPPVTKSAHIRLSERQKPVGEWSGKVMGVLCRNRLYGSFRSIPLQDFSPGRRFRTPSLAFSNCTQQFPIVIFIHIAIAINPVFLFPQSPALVFL